MKADQAIVDCLLTATELVTAESIRSEVSKYSAADDLSVSDWRAIRMSRMMRLLQSKDWRALSDDAR